jgi:Transposase domain (DUF772)
MKQMTLATNDFEQFRKPTPPREVPGREGRGGAVGGTGRGGRAVLPEGVESRWPPQLWFDLSDPAVEEALYDSLAMRAFVGVDLGREPVPDGTTVMRFRHLLEEHRLRAAKIFAEIGRVRQRRRLRRNAQPSQTVRQSNSHRLCGPSLLISRSRIPAVCGELQFLHGDELRLLVLFRQYKFPLIAESPEDKFRHRHIGERVEQTHVHIRSDVPYDLAIR